MKNQYPKISIVTPSYNQGEFIEETIKTIVEQDYPDLQYIIMDGGSTDNTVEIIKKYEHKIDYWQSKPDKGQSDAIIQGFDKATGDIIAWQNSDDIYLPGTLKTVGELFSQDPKLDLLFGGWRFIDEHGNKIRTEDRTFTHFPLRILRAGSVIPPQPAVFFRRAAYKRVGGLDISLQHAMDYNLYLKLSKQGKVMMSPKVFGGFRLHSASKTVSQSTDQLTEVVQVRQEILQAGFMERTYWKWCDNKKAIRAWLHKKTDVFSFREMLKGNAGIFRK